MFATLSLKELKQLVRDLRNNHNIAGYSRMKKDDLIKALSARFVFLNGAIYLKYGDQDRVESQRIQNELDKAGPPAVEPKKAKPRAKKAAPTEAAMTQKINKYFAGQKAAELKKLPFSRIVEDFEAETGVKLGEFKPLFKDLGSKFLQKR
jgi:hypothetical protein